MVNAEDLISFLIEFNNSPEKTKYGIMESLFVPVSFALTCFGYDTRNTSI